MPSKPTWVLVHGAWHGPDCFRLIIPKLESAGYPCTAVSCPSTTDTATPITSMEEDVTVIRSAITSATSQGNDVIVLCHSYGGLPTGSAVQGLIKSKETPEKAGVIRIVYLAAFALPVGQCLMDPLGGNDLPWFRRDKASGLVETDDPEATFYGDMNEEDAKVWTAPLRPFSYGMFHEKIAHAGYLEVPSTYVFCELDQAIPLPAQVGMVDEADKKGAMFQRVTLHASHSPFASMPDTLAKELLKIAGEGV